MGDVWVGKSVRSGGSSERGAEEEVETGRGQWHDVG